MFIEMFCFSYGQVVTDFSCRPGRLTSLLRWQTSLEFSLYFVSIMYCFGVKVRRSLYNREVQI